MPMSNTPKIEDFEGIAVKGRNARLLVEWQMMSKQFEGDSEVSFSVAKRNFMGLPEAYLVRYDVRSFCGTLPKDGDGLEKPEVADSFLMEINLPNNYPSADGFPEFRFRTSDDKGANIAHPWHPNIRYHGDFAGRVCLSAAECGTFTDLAWYVERVRAYLKYEKYNAKNTPPFPEDVVVAQWVEQQAEPNGWIENFRKNIK